jgi:acyl-[acyl-carrier-protein] desaturase
MEFFSSAYRKRHWSPFDDVPWDKLDRELQHPDDAICAETFCGVELYVPDYTANGFNLTRPIFGHAWFQAAWGFEESRHAMVFREYLLRSGQRTLEQYDAFEQRILANRWQLPFTTRRQMSCYGALQEAATYLIYRVQHERARKLGNEVLERLYFYVARDEAAHMGFYRRVLTLELEEDRVGTLHDLAHVITHFQMPGVGLIPEYDERLKTAGVGITSQHFMQHGIFPTLRQLGTTRTEIFRALRKYRAEAKAAPLEETVAP